MQTVNGGKSLGNASGRQKTSARECTHAGNIRHVQSVRTKKKTKCEFAGGCGSTARWICLAENCGTALCGKLAHNHSNEHNKQNPSHYLQLTNTGRIWCFACNKEVQLASDEETGDTQKHETRTSKKRIETPPKPVKRRHDSPERMETDEEDGNEKRALLPKAASREDDVASRVGVQGPPIPNGWNMALMEEERVDQMGGLTGLLNLGNTCYMNAALQALSNCPPIREYLRTYPIPAIGVTSKALQASAGPRLPVTESFRDLLLRIWANASRHAVSPRMLLCKVREHGPQFRGFAQQDSQEFIRCFLDWLHQELRTPVRAWEDALTRENTQRERSTSPKRSSLASSTSSSRNDLDSTGDANENFETADSGLSSDTDDSREDKEKEKKANANKVLRYRSIVSDIFDGELVSTVKCLTCQQLSDTKETFQDISLSIPTVEQLEMMREAALEMEKSHPSQSSSATDESSYLYWLVSIAGRWMVQPLVSWLAYFYRYMFTGAITLENCLKAFFSADHLHGEDMYSCDKCAKLRNGVKQCKVTRLPEILCIHLKRFRHDAMYNTKVGTRVTFPLCDLDMAPFVGENVAQDERLTMQYDLVAIVVHHGSSVDYGHYVAYCLNDFDKNWYEYDDSHVTRVSEPEVMSKEAYVLFYRKKTPERMEQMREHVKELMRKTDRSAQASNRYWISHEWLWKFFSFSEPGPITNTGFLCPHGNLSPTLSDPQELSSHVVTIPERAWDYLHEHFGGGPPCQQLAVCITCRQTLAAAKLRKERELNVFRSLNASTRYCDYLPPCVVPKHWFDRWNEFVSQLDAEPPGPIDNEPLLNKVKDSYRLRSSANFIPISYEAWNFFQQTYGGGPQVFKLLARSQLTPEEVAEKLHEAEEAQRSAREHILKVLSGENELADTPGMLQITDSEV